VADSAFNGFLVPLKLLLEDAERVLEPEDFHALRAILLIKLNAYDEEEVA
jgi:hypothetical protein